MNVAITARVDVVPLSKHIGAEIRGIDLRGGAVGATIRKNYPAAEDGFALPVS
jgi:hypothetical protein